MAVITTVEQTVKLNLWLIFLLGPGLMVYSCAAVEIHTTKVFVMTVNSSFFNWTEPKELYTSNQFFYRPSLLDAPDLPSWMYYSYSQHQNRGFVYGAPPAHQKDIQIEVVGLNRQNYEARRRIIKLNVLEKPDPAQYEIRLKLDKVNVEDILESDRYNQLLDVFRKPLWPDSQHDLYITFLASAVQLGARLPLKPFEGEGIVMHIGSRAPFSQTLLDLQSEVSPLRSKGQSTCPDFKHTSVERFFKQYNFSMDWCAFQLSEKKPAAKPPSRNIAGLENSESQRQLWLPFVKTELPTRNYLYELALTMAIPFMCFLVLVLLLTLILIFQLDVEAGTSNALVNSILVVFENVLKKKDDNTPHSQLVQYEAVQRASNNLRSLSTQRDSEETSPRVSVERTGLRPNPPPYAGVHNTAADESSDGEEEDNAKTWYC